MTVTSDITASRLPPENIYAHTKKLQFLMAQVDAYIKANGGPITVMDFGCGNGSAVSQFLIREDVNYFGVDIHQPSLLYARDHFSGKNVEFLDHVPQGILFDIIIYADNLEHLFDPVSVLREHWKVMKNKGVVLGAVPNGFGPFEMEKRVSRLLHLSKGIEFLQKIKRGAKPARGQASDIPYNHDSGHLQFFTKSSLIDLLHRGGFEIEVFQNGSFVGAPISERLLRGKRMVHANAAVADFLPHWAASTWYFLAKRNSDPPSGQPMKEQ